MSVITVHLADMIGVRPLTEEEGQQGARGVSGERSDEDRSPDGSNQEGDGHGQVTR